MTSLDPFTVTKKLKELISSEPWQIRYIMRVIPIETVIPTDLAAIAKTTRELALRINIGDTFRITVEKRHSDLSSKQVIAAMAAEINNRVRLQDPDWIVLAEIVGMQTGISVIRPGQIFSSILVKRDR
jgi:tRNA acetyltransferase TAN1